MSHLFARPTVFPVIDSTNRYLVDLAREGAPEGLVAIADVQSAGRGRRGRDWWSAPGASLLCSMLLRPSIDIARLHLVPTVVGLAAHRAVEELTGAVCEMKWPNDLLIDDKKVAGLLSEIVTQPTGAAIVVGIGINLAWPQGSPPAGGEADLAGRAISLAEVSGGHFDRDEVAGLLLRHVEQEYRQLGDLAVDATIMDRYRRACGTIGRLVRVETMTETFVAEATGISDEGRLLVCVQGERRTLDVADVVHLRTIAGAG